MSPGLTCTARVSVGITDPVEGQRRFDAYLASTEPDAARYKTFLTLRVDLEKIRRPQDQSPPYTPEELSLSEACNALWSRLAIAMKKAGPGLASKEVIDELQDVIGDYEKLKDQSKENNRAHRQALEAIAAAKSAVARTYLILRDYKNAQQWYQAALEAFKALGDQDGAQASQQQLASLRVVESGDVDAAVRSNLEVLTGEKGQARSFNRAGDLVGQLGQALSVGDVFEATKLRAAAEDELKRQQYFDPGFADVEPIFGNGSKPYRRSPRDGFLSRIGSSRTALRGRFRSAGHTRAGSRPREQLRALPALMNRMGRESMSVLRRSNGRVRTGQASPAGSRRAGRARGWPPPESTER